MLPPPPLLHAAKAFVLLPYAKRYPLGLLLFSISTKMLFKPRTFGYKLKLFFVGLLATLLIVACQNNTVLPRIFISIFAGIIVDRANRKHLMMLGDAIAASSTLAILILHLSGNLVIWHLYLAASINGGFGQIQELAYSTSITLLVSPQNYTRANSMNSVVHYGSNIIAPAIAGVLYPIIGLGGILPIDLGTFGVAIATLHGLK